MAKRKVIYESEDDDIDSEDRTKKSRATPDNELPGTAITNRTGGRRSERAGKGNGGRLAQMKEFERVQTEQSKRRSRIDIATQGEDVNPMAPSSHDIGERSSRRGRGSGGEVVSPTHEEQPVSASPQPEFMAAAPGQQFGFRIPNTTSHLGGDTRAPTRTRFSGVSSQSSKASVPPSSQSGSLFSNGGGCSTTATSRAPSVCSSMAGDRRLSRQQDPAFQHPARSSRVDVMDDIASQHDRASSSSAALAAGITASSKHLQISQLESSFSNVDDGVGSRMFQIDEVSPSEDERIAETNLRQAEYSGRSPPPDNERSSPSLEDDDRANDETVRYHQSQPSAHLSSGQAHSQSRDANHRAPDNGNGTGTNGATMRSNWPSNDRTCFQSRGDTDRRAPDNDIVTSTNGATPHSNQLGRHASRPSGSEAPSQLHPSQHAPPGDPAPNRSSSPAQVHENVVNIHRRRNRAPRLPTNSQLLAARQRQQALPVTGEAPSTNSNGQDRPSVDLQVSPASERADPWQLQYYDPPTRDVIERAKQFSHCDGASIDPFPARAMFNSKAIEYIDEAIAERRSRGQIISEGWWPHHASSISRLLWEDLGNWRSALRKKARTFVTQRYQWDPENRRDRNIQIAKDLLGNGGSFLRDGADEEGHTKNLAHPALSGLIIDFFYTSSTSIGRLFPEVFAEEVPRVTVALAATALKVVLDEVASGQGEVNFRVNTYSPVYSEILGLMSKCDTNVIHREKTSALRKHWAKLGSNGMNDQDPVVGGCGFDVDLD